MSGQPQGSSPRLSGVIHFLKMVEKDGQDVPFEVAPATQWTLRGNGSNDTTLFDDLDAEVKAHLAMMVFQNMLDVSNWADCSSLHLDVTYTDIEGNKSTHTYAGRFDIYVDVEDGMHSGVALEEAPFDKQQLRGLLNHLWNEDNDCRW